MKKHCVVCVKEFDPFTQNFDRFCGTRCKVNEFQKYFALKERFKYARVLNEKESQKSESPTCEALPIDSLTPFDKPKRKADKP